MQPKSLLPDHWQIPETLRDRVGDEPGHQRIMKVAGHMLIVLHAPPEPNQNKRSGCFLWRDPEGEWNSVGDTSGPAALTALLDQYKKELDELRDGEAAAKTSQEYFELFTRLSPLARSVRNLYKTLQEARNAENNDRRIIVARDRAYSLHRQAELLETDSRNALDFAIARKTEEQAESSFQMAKAAHRLNMMVAFFFPIATLSAIFGTNWQQGLSQFGEAKQPMPWLTIVIVGLVLGILLTAFVNWRMRPKGGEDCNAPGELQSKKTNKLKASHRGH